MNTTEAITGRCNMKKTIGVKDEKEVVDDGTD